MKERMKKVSVLAFHQDKEQITSLLQDLGVIHLELDEKAYNDDIRSLQERRSQIVRVLQTIRAFGSGTPGTQMEDKIFAADEVLTAINDLKRQMEVNEQKIEKLTKEAVKLKPWGEFDRKRVKLLEEKGLCFTFYLANARDFDQYNFGSTIYEVVHSGGKKVYFVTVEQGDRKALPFEQVQLPESTLSEIDRELHRLREENNSMAQKIRSYGAAAGVLEEEQKSNDSHLEYEVAMSSYGDYAEGKILYMKGWYPENAEKRITQTLDAQGMAYSTAEPGPGDRVPVKLKNSSYVGLFEPITRIFQLPNYHELDLTPVIAVFYPIFFAYCLGDAGYGLVVLAISIAGWFTFLRNSRNLSILGAILGAFTTLMGIVKSGSVFGLPLTGSDALPIFSFLGQFVFIPDDQDLVFNAFNVSLMIGVIQIFTGVISSIIKRATYQSPVAALPQVGKLLVIIGVLVIFLADMQNVEVFTPYIPMAQIALFAGIAMVLMFHNLTISLVKRIGSGILPLFFIFTGLLGDILSYVRLFALGVASSVLGLVVNQIGLQIMENGWLGIVLGIVFLLFGHTLNLALAILGAFVHPLRLTFVEFYNNAEFEGGGVEYKPFRKLKSDIK